MPPVASGQPSRDRGPVSVPLWRALRRAHGPVTVTELRLGRWERVGFVLALPGDKERYAFSDASAGLPDAPSRGTLSRSAWAALRRIGRPATFSEILQATGATDRGLYCRLWRWVEQGHLVKIAAEPIRFALTEEAPDVGEPPRVSKDLEVRPRRTARDRIWSAMRVLKRFDVPMLMMTAEASRRSCEDFISLLSRADYVRIDGYRSVRTGAANLAAVRDWSSYTLLRSTGPKAPTVTNPAGGERRLIDRNTGASFPVGIGVRQAREVNNGH